MNIIKKFLPRKKLSGKRNFLTGSAGENFHGIRKNRIVSFLLVLMIFGFSVFGPAGSFSPVQTVSALPPAVYGPITIGSLILSLLTGSGTATIPTGSLSNPNIADVAVAMDTEAFSIQNLIDEGVMVYDSAQGIIESWDWTKFNNLVEDEGLAAAVASSQIGSYISGSSLTSAAASAGMWSVGLIPVALAPMLGSQGLAEYRLQYGEDMSWTDYAQFLGSDLLSDIQEYLVDPLVPAFQMLKDNFFSLFSDSINSGSNNLEENSDSVYGNLNSSYYLSSNRYYVKAFFSRPVFMVGYISDGVTYLSAYNSGNSTETIYYDQSRDVNHNFVPTYNYTLSAKSFSGFAPSTPLTGYSIFDSYADLQDSLNDTKSLYPFSPVVININGNLQGIYDQPTTLQEGQQIAPISSTDYGTWADQAQDLTDQGNYDDNGALFTNFVNPFISIPSDNPSVNFPVPDVTDPTYNPGQITPDQPTIPDKPDITQEEQDEVISGTAPELQNIFPFCIPFDIVDFIKLINVQERHAPDIVIPIESELFNVHEEIEIDMSIFDDVAFLLRNLELITFIISLAVVTRYLIGAR